MRIPNRIVEHPVEAAIASLLLLTLLFGTAEFPSAKSPDTPPAAAAQKF
jgi:hypothetical protein